MRIIKKLDTFNWVLAPTTEVDKRIIYHTALNLFAKYLNTVLGERDIELVEMPQDPDDEGRMVYKIREQNKDGNYITHDPITVVLCGASPSLDFSSWPLGGKRKPKININT